MYLSECWARGQRANREPPLFTVLCQQNYVRSSTILTQINQFLEQITILEFMLNVLGHGNWKMCMFLINTMKKRKN